MGFKQIIFDHNLIMAIIAINITIIGLTSLAESKKIIGVDYGRFLIKKYRMFSKVRIYPLLIIFGVVNVSSLFLMFITAETFRLYNFIFLVISLAFAIYYFFAYIITENVWVRKQIYEEEITGLYYDDESKDHQDADKLVDMNGGSRTGKRLSTNLIDFFNTYNGDSRQAFVELFGPDSVLYIYSKRKDITKNQLRLQKRYTKRLEKRYGIQPYLYRRSDQGIYDISYEYFQLFRYSELQDKWIIDILEVFDNKRTVHQQYDLIRLYNFARVITQLNLFGNNDSIYKYKFLEYLIAFYYKSVEVTEDDLIEEEYVDKINEVEIYTYRQLIKFMFDGGEKRVDELFQDKARMIMSDVIVNDKYQGILNEVRLIEVFLEEALTINSAFIKKVFTDVLNEYYNTMTEEDIPVDLKEVSIRKKIEDDQVDSNNQEHKEVRDLF